MQNKYHFLFKSEEGKQLENTWGEMKNAGKK